MKKLLILLVLVLSMVGCSSSGYTVSNVEEYDKGIAAINDLKEKYISEGVVNTVHYTRYYLESAYTVIRLMSGEFGESASDPDYRYAQIQEVLSWDTTFEKEKMLSKTTLPEEQYNIIQLYEEEQIQYCNDLKDILIKINENYDGANVDYIDEARKIYDAWYKNCKTVSESIATNMVINMFGN